MSLNGAVRKRCDCVGRIEADLNNVCVCCTTKHEKSRARQNSLPIVRLILLVLLLGCFISYRYLLVSTLSSSIVSSKSRIIAAVQRLE